MKNEEKKVNITEGGKMNEYSQQGLQDVIGRVIDNP